MNDHDPLVWAQKLAEEARILGEARMLRDEQPLTDDLTRAVIAQFKALLERTGKSEQWAARSMGIGSSTLSQVLSGKYGADVEPMIRKIDKWIEVQVLREQTPLPDRFVRTRIAEMIYGVARWVQKINAIGLVTGPSGCGKSKCAQAVHAESPGSILIEIDTASQSKLAVLEMIARSMRLTGLRLNASALVQLLVSELKDTNRLLIVDQIDKLEGRRKDEALHTLSDLHTKTKIPMLWLGMPNIATYIDQGKGKWESLDQVASRIKFRLNLTAVANREDGGPGLFTIEDIRKWLAAQKVRITADGERYLQQIANGPLMGGLRTCEGIVLVAMEVAKGKPIDAEMLRDIFTDQRGTRFVESFEQQVEIRRSATA